MTNGEKFKEVFGAELNEILDTDWRDKEYDGISERTITDIQEIRRACEILSFTGHIDEQRKAAFGDAIKALKEVDKYEKVIEEVKRKIDVELELWTRMDANEAKNAFAVAFTLLKNYIEGATR